MPTNPGMILIGGSNRPHGGACRAWLFCRWAVATICTALVLVFPAGALAISEAERKAVVDGGLDWLASEQNRAGHWTAREGRYPAAMTALAGLALAAEGSTTTQGKYSTNIRRAVDYLTSETRARPNGLIGDPFADDRYTYGHGFSMLFLSQVLGEEEDEQRRKDLQRILAKAVEFTGSAQTEQGGWGYVSAKDGGGFDEGSTTVTQVQGLRACRNAGILVGKKVVDTAVKYIHDCTNDEGGVRYQYSSSDTRGRPAITAAAIACLFNAGEYDDERVPKMLEYCKQNLWNIQEEGFGHWHYAHYYYSQVLYREGGETWNDYRDRIAEELVKKAQRKGNQYYWEEGYIGPVYTTAASLMILQLDNAALPIYQR